MARCTVGVPREVKEGEHRVAITPDGVSELRAHDVNVLIERGAGADSSITDDDYRASGAEVLDSTDDVWGRADIVMKVKEPQSEEFARMRPGLVLFTYLHLAAYPVVADALLEQKVTGVAYETVQQENGGLPLLAPMSEVAGRMATQIGAHFLEREYGGRGILLGGVPGVPPAKVVVLGGGVVGLNAAIIALGMQADVWVLDKSVDRMRDL
jgi:alanine dehydrogenase